jgi:putative ABC transport system permease protein
VRGVDALREALETLRAHKGRSALTLFGIVWGTAAVIFLTGWGDGVRVMMERGFFKTGRNLGEVWAGRIGEDFTPAADRRWLWYTSDDLAALRSRVRLSELVGGERWEWAAATYRGRARNIDLRGTDPETFAIRGVSVAAGRPITQADLDHRRRVVVLGDQVRRTLLGPQGGVGSWIRLDGKPFQVVGLLARVGVQLSSDRMLIDEQVWAPLTTVQALFKPWWTEEPVVSKIVLRIRDRTRVDEAKQEVRGILAERLGVSPLDDEAVPIFSTLEMLNRFPLDQTRGLLFVLAVATLGVGGIGVLSMMLDAVHERRQEIGVRLALGATRRDVLWHFLIETLAITSVGGLLGAALGTALAFGLGRLEGPDLVPVPVLRLDLVWVALGVMVAVGVLAGVAPAWRAARVDPAVTLRME